MVKINWTKGPLGYGMSLAGISDYNILDKHTGKYQYVAYMLNRTNRVFEYTGLPRTIPAHILELYLQCNGNACFAIADTFSEQYQLKIQPEISVTLDPETGDSEVKSSSNYTGPDNLYIFCGNPGGEPDIYYRPTKYTVANPAITKSLDLTIGQDCVLAKNDMAMIGLLPLYYRYASQLVENDISIRSAMINSRQRTVVSAQTDEELESAKLYFTRLEEGRLGVIAEKPFLDGVKVQNAGVQQPNSVIQLIELQQYLKASWFNDIGLNSNFNMKREYLSEEEVAANTDMLLPLVDEMYYCRLAFCEEVNKMFGTSIEVKKGSAWADKSREVEASLEESEAKAGIQDTVTEEGYSDEETPETE